MSGRYRNLDLVAAADSAVLQADRDAYVPQFYGRSGRATGHPVRRYLAGMVEVRLSAVRVDLQSNTPVLLLMETEGIGRTLPIFIGAPEATAIAFALQGVPTPRPMTHDLLQDLLDTLDVKLERILITELRSATYFAELHLLQRNPDACRSRAVLRTQSLSRCARGARFTLPTT